MTSPQHGAAQAEQHQAPKRPALTQVTDRVFGRLAVLLSMVWAATILASAVAAKASSEFLWVLLVLIVGMSTSGAVVEAARRRLIT